MQNNFFRLQVLLKVAADSLPYVTVLLLPDDGRSTETVSPLGQHQHVDGFVCLDKRVHQLHGTRKHRAEIACAVDDEKFALESLHEREVGGILIPLFIILRQAHIYLRKIPEVQIHNRRGRHTHVIDIGGE